MFGIRFVKVPPTRYILHYVGGKVRREGPGLSFFYFAPYSTIISVPLASADVPFVFNETTADFQAITLQGQLSYRITDPKRIAGLLDFSTTSSGEAASEDPELLGQRLVQAAQILTRAVTQKLKLADVLVGSDALVSQVLPSLRQTEAVTMMGVQILGLTILSVKPTPEMARALEAEAREALQRQADEAIYARRNAAVVQERVIKENELQTEIAVEEKKRQIRETQMAGEIAVEEQRSTLIDKRVTNDCKEADCKAYALKASLAPVRDLDWRLVTALSAGTNDAGKTIAMAFQELAQNAQKIGELNLSPDLLQSLLAKKA